MNKFLTKLFLFFIMFIGLNGGYLFVCMHLDWNFSKRREAIQLSSPVYETVILGNSLAMDGIDTKKLTEMGESAYNLAIGGASLRTNYIQLTEYLSLAQKKPKKVILAIGSFRDDTFQKTSIHPMVDFTRKNHAWTWHDLPMLKFKWVFPELLKKIVSTSHRKARLVQGQLRIEGNDIDQSSLPTAPEPLNLKLFRENIQINMMAELCSSLAIKFIIIEVPGFRNTRNSSPLGLSRIKLNNGLKIDVFNFNGEGIDEVIHADTDWLGGSHLNKHGAEKFTVFSYENYLKTKMDY